MKTIKASEFKAKCLKLMDEVAATGEPLLITKHGKPVAELVPTEQKPKPKPKRKSLLGLHKGQMKILGDIMSPLEEDWEVLR